MSFRMSLHTSLLVCPKNLKECIDWVLRATGKDIQNGADNIDKLKKALNAVVPSFDDNSIDLTQLVHGLCLFMGYPSCLCSLKANVNESLKDISKKLIQDFEAVKSCVSITTLTLNCSCDSEKILCKCCVISCIKELRDTSKSQCPCLSNTSTECKCQGTKGKCCKDFLSGLEACLSLLNLQTDMKDCDCDGKKCCKTGTCSNKSCTLCSPKKFPDNAMTGLGICPMNPRKLAEKLEKFFGNGQKSGCGCKCGTSNKSCCCLACQDCSSQNCFCLPGSKCSCASKLKLPKKPSECPRKVFCIAINDIKIAAQSTEMICCTKGTQCHCQVDKTCSPSSSGQNCCVEKLTDSNGQLSHQSLKCLLRRLVKFFKDFESSSQPKSSCLCCDLLCVLKMCESFRDFYNKKDAKVCNTCRKKGGKGCSKAGNCCKGPNPKCGSSSSQDPCKSCSECRQICDSKKFYRELQKLQYSGPCGLDLYRLLKDLLNFIRNVFMPQQNFIHSTVLEAVKDCSKCKKSAENSSDWKACQCSSGPSSNCSACTSLLKDSKLMSILRHGYISSYTYKFLSSFDTHINATSASWKYLCASGSKCCSNPSCSKCQDCSSGSPCDPSKCCPDCPQRKAAKIFLGMLPCLYYGLKILYDRCQYGSDFPDWHLQNISQGSIGNFLKAWGFTSSNLSSKYASGLPVILDSLYGSSDSPGSFDKIYHFVSKEYFSRSPSSGSQLKPPKTVRQMLLWLYGLRFTSGFSSLVSHCSSLCIPFGNSYNADAFCYYLHLSCFLLPVSFISTVQHSQSHVSTFFSTADSEILKFHYPSDPSDLFEKFCEYSRKIFVALTFLKFQCDLDKDSAGWNDCAFGRGCAQALQNSSTSVSSASSPSSSSSSGCSCLYSKAYLCTAINKDKVHDHCLKGSCRGFPGSSDSCSGISAHPQSKPGSTPVSCTPCPHPLQRFLIDGSSDSDSKSTSKDYPFGLSGITPMGFSQKNLSSTARDGWSLYHVIEPFCESGFYPLTRLVQFILCVSRTPPETLGELFAFFQKLAEALKSKTELSSKFVEWIEGEPGEYSGGDLKKALEDLYGSSHSSSSHTPANLFSLSSCHANIASKASCGPYLHALTEEVSGLFVEDLVDSYLSWVCYLTPKFKTLLEEFQGKFSSCCSSCQNIVKCPCALATLYSQGFVYYSPSGLGCWNSWEEHEQRGGVQEHTKEKENSEHCTRRTCKNFIDQLEKVISGEPLEALLKAIDEFLWSIRLPFFLFVWAFWAFVISYFLYVQLYKLDLLHLKSHAHFSRSFKILPSTLLSDASSKLKDLSYFTL
ncbi:variant erythrocyte surface antigen-1 family protein [Babesia divergens]|uniref:Variant erythrocyte surface antigen-1 family protein n=1 Tax=Babesia divergens TaxID=32595 RepID=A0AAD9GIH4_BABDI|nr:variant erythrocyte surface antigen-1 family protein [Babesia divergens]